MLPVTRSGGMPVLDAAHHAKPTKDVEHGGGTHMPNQQKGAPVLCAVPVPLRAVPVQLPPSAFRVACAPTGGWARPFAAAGHAQESGGGP